MNIGVIFAGGSGKRMHSESKPKQFLELYGKPVIIYTLEVFETHPDIDAVVVVCIESWIPYLEKLLRQYEIRKVAAVVEGGQTGQDSICHGIRKAAELYDEDSIVLIHDGVRPLINAQTITDNIRTAMEYGNCITCIPTIETFMVHQKDGSFHVPERKDSLVARAPQTFVLKDVLAAHEAAQKANKHDFIDTCTMMNHYGHRMHTIIGPMENIKITTPMDFFLFKAIVEARESEKAFGI